MSEQPKGVRFAPSPTGRFHIGNLRTAWISHTLARQMGEPWIVRFEDIDGPRVAKGAQELQLSDLQSLGMLPDQVLVQSHALRRHVSLFKSALAAGKLYPCTCSRREVQEALAQMASAPHGSTPIYSGKCRERTGEGWNSADPTQLAWRLKSADVSGAGDVIVARTVGPEFQPAYHWACAIDDYDGNYRLLVRAWDLESAAGPQRQIFELASRLEAKDAKYPPIFHTSLVTADDGSRLEKRTQGVTWPELQAQGWSAGKLIAAFLSSLSPGVRPPGEPQRVLEFRQLLGSA